MPWLIDALADPSWSVSMRLVVQCLPVPCSQRFLDTKLITCSGPPVQGERKVAGLRVLNTRHVAITGLQH